MHVNQGVSQIFMAEQNLNGAEIGAGLIEMCRETMAQRVGVDAFLDAAALGGFARAKRFSYRWADPCDSCWETARCWISGGSNAIGCGVP